MEYNLTDAAAKAGVNRATLWRAIKNGRLSARRLEDGSYMVDAAELHRAYPAKPAQEPARDGATIAPQQAARAGNAVEAELRKQIASLEATVEDQRKRLDAAEAALATAQSATREAIAAFPKQIPPPGTPAPVTERPRRWWQR